MTANKSKVLFFIAGPVPSAAEISAAASIEDKATKVVFRNASAIGDGDSVENADGLAGVIPDFYKVKLPDAKVYAAGTKKAAPAAPVVATTDGDANTPAGNTDEGAAAQRAAEDEGARGASVAQLKEALKNLSIEFPANAKKADLLALFLNR